MRKTAILIAFLSSNAFADDLGATEYIWWSRC